MWRFQSRPFSSLFQKEEKKTNSPTTKTITKFNLDIARGSLFGNRIFFFFPTHLYLLYNCVSIDHRVNSQLLTRPN